MRLLRSCSRSEEVVTNFPMGFTLIDFGSFPESRENRVRNSELASSLLTEPRLAGFMRQIMNSWFVSEDRPRLIRTQSEDFCGFVDGVDGFIKRRHKESPRASALD